MYAVLPSAAQTSVASPRFSAADMHSPALAATGVGGSALAAVHRYKPTALSSRREGAPFRSPTWPRRPLPLPQSTVSVPAAPEGRCALRSRSSFGREGEGGDVGGRTKGWIHFVGIGGCGLSALAMLALEQGFEVSGSDIVWSDFMDQLHQAGARLYIGHSISNMLRHNDSSLPIALIISSAIPAENVEVSHAKALGIPVYKRDIWLRKITEHRKLVAVCGTHGKSTTSGMLSYVLYAMGKDVTAVVGAHVPQLPGGNIVSGYGPLFVLEADEYDGCFLELSPYVAVITNVEWEHVDCFANEDAVRSVYRRFLLQMREEGHLILCRDSAGACALLGDSVQKALADGREIPTPESSRGRFSVVTYGTSFLSDWCASSIIPNAHGGEDYTLYHRGNRVEEISIRLPGIHNVLNSLAVIATMSVLAGGNDELYDTIQCVKYHLGNFEGISRRFELVGKVKQCHIYDDYAHHPTEICAVLQGARERFPCQEIIVVFQPHTFSRLAAMIEEFAAAFSAANHVIVTEVYASREMNPLNISGKDLTKRITGPSSEYIPALGDVLEELTVDISSRGNWEAVVLTLGAGDITRLGPTLLSRLQRLSEGS